MLIIQVIHFMNIKNIYKKKKTKILFYIQNFMNIVYFKDINTTYFIM